MIFYYPQYINIRLMKRKINYSKLITIIALFLTSSYGIAQNQTDSLIYNIETNDGNTYMGHIITQDSLKILFISDKLGKINILKDDIKEMYPLNIEKIKDGKYWFENPQATRYFFSPNGYGLQRGEGYYQNVWVLINSFAYGLTENISIGGGAVPLFFFGGAPTPIWATVKLSIPVIEDRINMGVGVLAGTVIGEEETGFGILYGISTFGSKDNNVSIGLGYGYAGGEWAKSPIININAMIRTGARGYFLTENYIIQSEGETLIAFSLGGRQIIKNIGLDYGLIIPLYSDMGTFIVLPWLGITIPFGKR